MRYLSSSCSVWFRRKLFIRRSYYNIYFLIWQQNQIILFLAFLIQNLNIKSYSSLKKCWHTIINITKYLYFSQVIWIFLRGLIFNFEHEGFISLLSTSSASPSELYRYDLPIQYLFLYPYQNRRKNLYFDVENVFILILLYFLGQIMR